MELERDAFDEVPQIVCAAYDVRIWRARSPSDGDRPSMGMALWRELPLGGGQHRRCVSIYDWPMNCHALSESKKWAMGRGRKGRTYLRGRGHGLPWIVRVIRSGGLGNPNAVQTPTPPNLLPIVPNHTVHVHHVPRLARQSYVHLPQLTNRLLIYKKSGPNTVLDQQKAFQVGRL